MGLLFRMTGVAIFSLVAAFFPLSGISESNPQGVLFVGNSFSFYNNGIHTHVGNLFRSDRHPGDPAKFRMLTLSGARLNELEHAANEFMKKNSSGFSKVVFHDHSNAATAADFADDVQRFARMISSNGSQPLLMMTWGYKNENAMAIKVQSSYENLSSKLNIPLIPSGSAFLAAQESNPEIELYVPDLSGTDENGEFIYKKTLKHPSMAGTYLAACVIFAKLSGRSPVNNPYNANLDEDVARSLQRVAWETINKYR